MKKIPLTPQAAIEYFETVLGHYVNAYNVEFNLNRDRSISIVYNTYHSGNEACALYKDFTHTPELLASTPPPEEAQFDKVSPAKCRKWYKEGSMSLYCCPDLDNGAGLIFALRGNELYATDFTSDEQHRVTVALRGPRAHLNYTREFFKREYAANLVLSQQEYQKKNWKLLTEREG